MTKLFSFLLFFTLSISAQGQRPKIPVDTSEISSVEILKVILHSKLDAPKKILTKKQYTDFAQKWNASKILGADKYGGKYYIYVFLKNGEKRQFAIFDSKIQESNWQTYGMGDKKYFDKIWTAIK